MRIRSWLIEAREVKGKPIELEVLIKKIFRLLIKHSLRHGILFTKRFLPKESVPSELIVRSGPLHSNGLASVPVSLNPFIRWLNGYVSPIGYEVHIPNGCSGSISSLPSPPIYKVEVIIKLKFMKLVFALYTSFKVSNFHVSIKLNVDGPASKQVYLA